MDHNDPKALKLIEGYLSKTPKARNALRQRIMSTQTEMLFVDGELAVDKLFYFEEDMPGNVHQFLTDSGVPLLQMPHKNGKRKHEVHISVETMRFVAEFYADDYKNFRYGLE